MNDVPRILTDIEQGNGRAAEQLLPLLYDELKKLATQKLCHERRDQTLQATALVHEAYLRLVDGQHSQSWESHGHFFAAAAEAMRRVLVDRARKKMAEKRGGGQPHAPVAELALAIPGPTDDLLALNEALEKLEKLAPLKASVVKLRFFAGLTVPQVAQSLGISASTADNYWSYARAWLRVELSDKPGPGKDSQKSRDSLG